MKSQNVHHHANNCQIIHFLPQLTRDLMITPLAHTGILTAGSHSSIHTILMDDNNRHNSCYHDGIRPVH